MVVGYHHFRKPPYIHIIIYLFLFSFMLIFFNIVNLDLLSLPETNSSHLKIGHPKRKPIFQPQCFRCYASCREGKMFGKRVLKNLSNGGFMVIYHGKRLNISLNKSK